MHRTSTVAVDQLRFSMGLTSEEKSQSGHFLGVLKAHNAPCFRHLSKELGISQHRISLLARYLYCELFASVLS